jgi:hypothetical protein
MKETKIEDLDKMKMKMEMLGMGDVGGYGKMATVLRRWWSWTPGTRLRCRSAWTMLRAGLKG